MRPQFIIVLISVAIIIWLAWRTATDRKRHDPHDDTDR